MKKIITLAFVAVAAIGGIASTAHADDYSRIPASIRAQIKQKCVARYPDDYSLQDGCIMNQSDSYLKVHGSDVENWDMTGDPSAFDRAQINNAAFLTVAGKFCKLDTAKLVEQYKANALKDGRLTKQHVSKFVAQGVAEATRAAKKSTKTFCAEATKNMQIYIDDLARN